MKALTPAEAITSRMSVRAFTKENVSKETILKLLNMGTSNNSPKIFPQHVSLSLR